MKLMVLISILILPSLTRAQDLIQGSVKDTDEIPLTGANVYIQGTYKGTITDQNGRFSFYAEINDSSLLVISFLGYETKHVLIQNPDEQYTIVLKPESNTLEAVQINAGIFGASEENRAVALNPIDIVTTASSEGDIYAALSTFPGAQKLGETGQIIVRGGEASESRTYVDGMLVSSPYTSSMPDLPARGRFSPFMFNGVMFSTGGYSAEYGQALSSVLELQTPGLFDEDVTSLTLMNVGAGASLTRRYARSAFSASANYNNTYPYFLMAKHDLSWIKIPQSMDAGVAHRQKIGKTGMIRTEARASLASSELDYSRFGYGFDRIAQVNDNEFIKSVYNTKPGDKTLLKTGLAWNRNADISEIDSMEVSEKLSTLHIKMGLIHFLSEKITLKGGSEATYQLYDTRISLQGENGMISSSAEDWIMAGYAEADFQLFQTVALRSGLRSAYSTLTGESILAPRASAAWKVHRNHQISLAWGTYHQQPHHEFLVNTSQLQFEQATHYLINYQVAMGRRLFRAELYNKEYSRLVSYSRSPENIPVAFSNSGDGYARGIDVFWKDDDTFRHTSYWISYSYVDSKRKYRDYPESAMPDFVSRHNLSLVYKRWIEAITTQVALSYTYASGRNYDDPADADFMAGKTPAIHDLSGNLSYITDLFGWFTVVHFSVNNILGLEHIYGYRYPEPAEAEESVQAIPVSNPVQRTIILGLFISID